MLFDKQKREIFRGLTKIIDNIIVETDITKKNEKLKKLKMAFLEIELDLNLNSGIETLKKLNKSLNQS